jgi:hypothetical protein
MGRELKFMMVVTLLFCTFSIQSLANSHLIRNGAIDGVRVGDPAKKIFSVFNSRYIIKDTKKPGSARLIILQVGEKTVVKFSVDTNEKIFFIQVNADYVTQENIGCGSTLSEAISAYGNGNLGPTDEGYTIEFQKKQGMSFLLNNNDIPKELRNIPDDVFTADQERKIMSIWGIRILAIQIYVGDQE